LRRILITGASSGLGRAFAEAALYAEHAVTGTVRKSVDAEAFKALHPTRARAVVLDVAHFGKVAPTVATLEREFGPIDVLVNNAGYGHECTVEESPLEELLRQFHVNVFGAVAMMKAALPWMRGRRRGRMSTSRRPRRKLLPISFKSLAAEFVAALRGTLGHLAVKLASSGLARRIRASARARTHRTAFLQAEEEQLPCDGDSPREARPSHFEHGHLGVPP
jgi:NAD(P)-dependent dehydrogenase (short-subunit alcohol dehydrogenase family)